MDLKTKIKKSDLINPDSKKKLLGIFDKLTEQEKQKLEKALNVGPASLRAIEAIKKTGKKIVKDIRKDVETTEKQSAESDLEKELNNL
jgi:hypothetical protein